MAEKDPIDRISASAEGQSDAAFAARVLTGLPDVPVPGVLEARILDDFDTVAAKRKASLRALAVRLVQSLRDAVWPNAPAWKPASIFVLSLLIGLAAGSLVPTSALTSVNSDEIATAAPDVVPDLDLSGDF
ncbi:MAG: hypothetical protein ABSD21_00615 [Rhizomicrobium sp.]|jgi:hypothetical protein